MFYSLRGSAQGGAGKWQKRMRAGADFQQPNNLIQSTFESTIFDILFFLGGGGGDFEVHRQELEAFGHLYGW